MKFARYGHKGDEKPAIVDTEGRLRDLSHVVDDINGKTISSRLDEIRALDLDKLPLVDPSVRYGSCIGQIGKFICVGLNYADHAAETGAEIPDEPVIFTKWTSAISGPNDDIHKPRTSTKLDWEIELGIVIGKEAKYVSEEEAAECIAGYCVINDVSERAFQLEKGGQWDLGKGCDTFGPTGPWLVTKDEVADVQNLHMWLEVNGKRFQDGNTSTMIFKPAFIVSYLSQHLSLQPGDVISTGTPPGVGLGQTPPVYLNVGDVIELGIEGLGNQRQVVVAAD